MAKAATKSEVAKVKADQLPATTEFEDFAGAGLENVTSSDILIPRLGILQALSPQLKKSKSEYIEGGEAGMIADVGTGETFPDGVIFLPVYYRKDFIEWFPRDTGKGIANIHPDATILDQCKPNDRGQMVLPNANIVIETAQFFGLNISADRRMTFIPMASTQLKKAKKLNTLAKGEKLRRGDGSEYVAPLFYRTYNLTTAEESNNDGEWFGWKIERGLALPEFTIEQHGFNWREVMQSAIDFRQSIINGEVRGDVADPTAPEGEAAM